MDHQFCRGSLQRYPSVGILLVVFQFTDSTQNQFIEYARKKESMVDQCIQAWTDLIDQLTFLSENKDARGPDYAQVELVSSLPCRFVIKDDR